MTVTCSREKGSQRAPGPGVLGLLFQSVCLSRLSFPAFCLLCTHILNFLDLVIPLCLGQNGMPALVNLPTVGENLQGYITTTMGAEGVGC